MEWTDRVDQLLYDGERERHRVDLDAATIVVTTHRLLAFTPGGRGKDFRDVDRPNVRRIAVETDGNLRQAVRAIVAGLLGAGLFATASVVDASGLFGGTDLDSGGPVASAAESALEIVRTLLVAFDVGITLVGVCFLAIAVAFGVRYVKSRSRRLIVRIAGEENLDLPVTDVDVEAGRVTELANAIDPSTPASDADDAAAALPPGDADVGSKREFEPDVDPDPER
ncbi:hypothetical protein [Halosolutus gelatinilyticus]|uniref:hypothetical protein n=1 Tax=Halosolutus gelatinilyticus TaxID=2931975 RepID=UPI001FF1FACA|nr:hypothetical protein [Halosolutus gelatinilyticus]